MISPQQRRDKLVRATDLDALSCRYNTNEKGYFNPPDKFVPELIKSYQKYLPYCQGYTNLLANRTIRQAFQEQKLPLINRGTYFRTKSIDIVLQEFVEQYQGLCQVVSLGSGSDTRGFRVLEKYPSTVYHEIDFSESTRIKRAAIESNAEIQNIIGYNSAAAAFPDVTSSGEFLQVPDFLHTSKYHLYGFDLRDLDRKDIEIPFPAHVDTTLPTLVISECVLCYLTPEENARVISYWYRLFNATPSSTLAFLIYEPMSLNDVFGKTMVSNLLGRGITLPTFEKFPTIESKREFFQDMGFTNVRVTDLSVISGYEAGKETWISNDELQKINRLELIDEIEEIRLLLKHYCLVYAGIGQDLKSSRW